MFSNPNLWVMICGILLGLTLIVSSVVFVNKLFVNSILPDEQNNQLFDLIKTLVLMIFSYYFGTKTNSNNNKDDNGTTT